MSVEERPTWDAARLAMARELAKRSLCTRDQVGAVITDADNRIVAEGYNGPPAGYVHGNKPCIEWCQRAKDAEYRRKLPTYVPMPDYSDCPSLHAEANALMMSDRTTRKGGTLYVTSFPCGQCRKLISNSGLARIVIGVDGKHEYRYQESDYNFLRKLGIRVIFEDGREPPFVVKAWWGYAPSEEVAYNVQHL